MRSILRLGAEHRVTDDTTLCSPMRRGPEHDRPTRRDACRARARRRRRRRRAAPTRRHRRRASRCGPTMARRMNRGGTRQSRLRGSVDDRRAAARLARTACRRRSLRRELPHVRAVVHDLDVQIEPVARHDRVAELRFVDAEKIHEARLGIEGLGRRTRGCRRSARALRG